MHEPLPAANLLGNEASPYLLQHAGNPVHWRPWGPAALAEAQRTGKPILLSVGYAACHWCHVMAHESFEDPDIAALMNRLFVNVKVDREERPDIDQIYMAALHAMGEQGGWPLTMFLDPEGRPFWGGTYFPPRPAFGRPGFPQLLVAVDKAFREGGTGGNAQALSRHIAETSRPPSQTHAPAPDLVPRFCEALLDLADPVNGGIRGAPKFPNAPMTEIMLRRAEGRPDSPAGKAYLLTLTRMAQGGIYDHLGGGLARYSVDERWLVPHFEKMLYDNAHFLRALVAADRLSPAALFRARIEETIGWLLREMLLPEGAFSASIDADSEGAEGRYYVWSGTEIDEILGEDATTIAQAYGVTAQGNFEHANILNRLHDPSFSAELDQRLSPLRARLLERRDKRIRPGLDDKILADWNGYAVRALAEAGFAFVRPEWIAAAETAFRFIAESSEEPWHSWRGGRSVRPALATDHGAMANAALSLFLATGEQAYLDHVARIFAILESDHSDGAGGFFLTSTAADDLIVRPRADADDANPSGSSQILEAMARLAQIEGDPGGLRRAHTLAANLHAATRENRYGAGGFHCAVDTLFSGRHVTIFAPDRKAATDWLDVLRDLPDPALTWQVSTPGKPVVHFGMEVTAPSSGAAAIVCTANACSAPLATPAALREALRRR